MSSRVLLPAAGVLAAAVWAVAQQTPPPPPKPDPAQQGDDTARISVEVTRVSMLFSVIDRKGRFVTDLTRDDFDVLENKHPQVIQEFAAESNLPLRLGILIDTSNSIRERFRFEQDAAGEFLKDAMRTNNDKAMVLSFDSNAEMVADLTTDTDKLDSAIRGLHAGGGTALYDAIYMACHDKLAQEQPSYKFRRVVVVVSDGEDNSSQFTRDQALEMALKSDVVIFAISTNMTRIESDGDKVLKYFTQQTGGRAFFPFKVEDLAQSFEVIAEEVRHQYTILYRPEPLIADGLFHQVQVSVKGHKELIVRARNGYYAPKK
ncbi:MAG: VWA domain-containing protein [Bryobacteraceae bacterium]